MADGPHTWGLNEDIIVELFVGDPNTGKGLTGKSGVITLTIKKRLTNSYWNGSTYGSVTPFALTMTEVSAVDKPGLYRYILPSTANTQVDEYFTHASVSDFPTVEGDDYAVHIVRDPNPTVKVYESEPIVVK